jgi:hypothetical protein
MTPRPDDLGQLTREQPVTDEHLSQHVDPATMLALRDAIVATPRTVASESVSAAPRRRVSRRLVAPLSAMVLVTGGAAAYATLHGAHDTQGIACVLPSNTSGIAQVTGDPVRDCMTFWNRNGVTPPAGVAAYETGNGIVVAAPDQAPEGAVRLPARSVQDPALIEQAASLQDPVDGLYNTCRDASAATTFVRSELQRLAVTGWTVIVDSTRPPQGDACATAITDDSQRTITLVGMTDVVPVVQSPVGQFASRLRHHITDTCVPLDAAREIVKTSAQRSGVHTDAVVIDALEDRTTQCTRVDLVVGGQFAVTLHGPSSN